MESTAAVVGKRQDGVVLAESHAPLPPHIHTLLTHLFAFVPQVDVPQTHTPGDTHVNPVAHDTDAQGPGYTTFNNI